MNKVIIVDASESDRRLMSGLLVKHGYEPIAVESMEAAKEEVAKLPPGAVVVTAMKFAHGTAQELVTRVRDKNLMIFNQSKDIEYWAAFQGRLIYLYRLVLLIPEDKLPA